VGIVMRRQARRSVAPPVVLLIVAGLLALSAGCTDRRAASSGAHRPPEAAGQVPATDLDASVMQSRFDEGTAHLRAGVVNGGDRDITVTRATLVWDGLRFSSVRLPAEPVHPGQAAAFTVDYGRPRCARPPTARPRLEAVVDGRTRRLRLRVEDPGLLRRLRAAACARVLLDRQVAVRLVLDRATRGAGTSERLPGNLVLTRPARSGVPARPVEVVALRGSVLFVLSATSRLPATSSRTTDRLDVPVTVGSTLRCDGHARGQASQPFLLAAYLRVRGEATQRVVLVPSVAEQERLLAMLDRVCG
jgi:hypothetical protein